MSAAARLQNVLLEALAASSAYVQDLDAEGAAIAAENGEAYTGNQGVIVDGVIDPAKVVRALLQALRKPTAKMLEAGSMAIDPSGMRVADAEDAFAAMIDAVIAEGTEAAQVVACVPGRTNDPR